MNKMLLSVSFVTIGMINCADMVIEFKNSSPKSIDIEVHKGLVKSSQGFFDFYGPKLETKHVIYNCTIDANSSSMITVPAGYNLSIFIYRYPSYQYCTLDRAILAGSSIVEVKTATYGNSDNSTVLTRKNEQNNLEVIFIGKDSVELGWIDEKK